MHLVVAAKSGWGKSAKSQEVIEKNLPNYEHGVVLDYKDEYRGLVKAGFADHWIVGPTEADWSVPQWETFIESNPKIVLARLTSMSADTWRTVCGRVVAAARRLRDAVIAIDEAHFVAPQKGSVPDAIGGLATTGRGEQASSILITQRLAKLEEDVLSQAGSRLLGGFESDADLGKVGDVVEYPSDVHNPGIRSVAHLPDDLAPGAQKHSSRESPPDSLQKHEENGSLVASEWIYSDDSGDRHRRSTRGLMDRMESTHYGLEGKGLKI